MGVGDGGGAASVEGTGLVAEADGGDALGEVRGGSPRDALPCRRPGAQLEGGSCLRAHDDVAVEVVVEDLLRRVAVGGGVPDGGPDHVPLEDAAGGVDDDAA